MRFAQSFRASSGRVRLLAVLCLLFVQTSPGIGQQSVEREQAFLDLAHDGVIMNISAHPDDEDGATLAYYRMKYGVKTYSILFTRGEGGQNEIGPELYEDLGVLRTAETQDAGKILGAEVHFLNFQDFGYSKTATETFKKWGGMQNVLRRLVFVIRKYKPDVVFTNHNTVDGHGHHQVVAITAIAAFDVAADSTVFPDQLTLPGIALWQPRKLFFRNFGRGQDQSADVVNQIGETDPVRKQDYLDIATKALRQHKTQGMENADLRRWTRGLSLYRLMRSNSIYQRDTTTFFGGIDLWSDPSLAPLQGGKEQLMKLRASMNQDSLLNTISSVMTLAQSRIAFSVVATRVLTQWQEELEGLFKSTCGVSSSWKFADRVVVPTQKIRSTFLLESAECTINDVKCGFDLSDGWTAREQSVQSTNDRRFVSDVEVIVGEKATPSLPKTVALYNPLESEHDVVMWARFMANGKPVLLSVKPAFDVAPIQTLTVTPKVTRISPAHVKEGKKLAFTLKNFAPRKTAGRINVQAPAGWRAEPVSYAIPKEDSTANGVLFVKAPDDVVPGEFTVRVTSEFASDAVTVRVFDVQSDDNISLGIIKSYDNTLEAAANELGVKYSLLSSEDLDRDLSPYHSIVVDIRAYLVREDLKKNNQRLLEYVRNGGNLVVTYQKDQDWKSEYAPYPLQLTRKRVSVEEAPIVILKPKHPLFTSPNPITAADWDGWIQERGVYFPGSVSHEYVQLLSSSDPDEQPLTTGYLVADYGKGSYIYTSYVWYRQLKEYNAGAFRCFINMISYPNHRNKIANP